MDTHELIGAIKKEDLEMSRLSPFAGMRYFPNAELPRMRAKMVLPNHLCISEKFRSEYNEWLRSFFGEELLFFIVEGGAIIAHPDNIKLLPQRRY